MSHCFVCQKIQAEEDLMFGACEECALGHLLARCEGCDCVLTTDEDCVLENMPLGTYIDCVCEDECDDCRANNGDLLFCSACLEEYEAEHITACMECGQDFPIRVITYIDDEPYCEDCVADHK